MFRYVSNVRPKNEKNGTKMRKACMLSSIVFDLFIPFFFMCRIPSAS